MFGQPVPVSRRHLATLEHRRAIAEADLRATPFLEAELPPQVGAGRPVFVAEPPVRFRGGALFVLEAIHGGWLTTAAALQRRRRMLAQETGDGPVVMAPRVAVAVGGPVAEVVPLIPEPAAGGHHRITPLMPLELGDEAFSVQVL